MGQLSGQAANAAFMVGTFTFILSFRLQRSLTNLLYSSVIAVNLLSTDEILRAGRSSLKPDGQQ